MRQIQITTEAGVVVLLMMFIFVIVVIAIQQNKLTKNINEINYSVKKTQEAVESLK